jgi:uncharacterized protein (UPF0333 family)
MPSTRSIIYSLMALAPLAAAAPAGVYVRQEASSSAAASATSSAAAAPSAAAPAAAGGLDDVSILQL